MLCNSCLGYQAELWTVPAKLIISINQSTGRRAGTTSKIFFGRPQLLWSTDLMILDLAPHYTEGIVARMVVNVDSAEARGTTCWDPFLIGVVIHHDSGSCLADALFTERETQWQKIIIRRTFINTIWCDVRYAYRLSSSFSKKAKKQKPGVLQFTDANSWRPMMPFIFPHWRKHFRLNTFCSSHNSLKDVLNSKATGM